jgi:hypothetical protein
MADVGRIKQLSAAHANLLAAANYLEPASRPPEMPSKAVPLEKVLGVLSETSLHEWMAKLSAGGAVQSPKAGFWRALERAAESLALHEQQATFRTAFLTVARHGITNTE